ncbi:hypothetical protein [Jeotgalibaca sp. A122]|uniref:hypothetical protein n=1 Tax=Jeotgalibaca sp. A122 TaxID=3457322 RepID=UPI003FD5BD08
MSDRRKLIPLEEEADLNVTTFLEAQTIVGGDDWLGGDDGGLFSWQEAEEEPTVERRHTAFHRACQLLQRDGKDLNPPFTLEELTSFFLDLRYHMPNVDELAGVWTDQEGLTRTREALALVTEGKGMNYEEAYLLVSTNRVYDAYNEPLPLENPDAFLLYGMGPSPHMQAEIDWVYEKNPDVYYAHYRKSRHVADKKRYMYPTEQLMTIEKMAGIASYVRDTGDNAPLKQLLNKGYKRLQRYLDRNQVLRYRDIQKIWQKDSWRYEQLDGTMAYHRFIQVVIALITASGKETEGMFRFYYEYFEIEEEIDYWDLGQLIAENERLLASWSTAHSELTIIEEFRERFFHDGHVMNGISRIMDHERERVERLMEKEAMRPDHQAFLLEAELRLGNPVAVNVRHARDRFSSYGFPPRFFDRSLSADEWTYFFQSYCLTVDVQGSQNATYEEQFESLLENLVSNLFQYVLARDFFDTRSKYLKGIDQSNAAELTLIQEKESHRREILERELGKEREYSRAAATQAAVRFDALAEKEAVLQRETKRLEQALEKATERERVAEERIRFLEATLAFQEEEGTEEADTQLLNGKHIIVLAGRVDWHKKLQATNPSWEFVEAEQLVTRDLTFLDNPDALVFYNTRHSGHSAYHRVKGFMDKLDKPLYPIGDARNVELTQKEMAAAMMRFSPHTIIEEAK